MTVSTLAWKRTHGRAVSQSLPAYTPEQFLDALRAVAVDGYVSVAMYRRAYDASGNGAGRRLPCPMTAVILFGSWNAAVEAAGLRHGNAKRTYSRLSESELLRHLRLVIDAMDDLPSVNDYNGFRVLNPDLGLACNALIRRRFGSWPVALERALALSSPDAPISRTAE